MKNGELPLPENIFSKLTQKTWQTHSFRQFGQQVSEILIRFQIVCLCYFGNTICGRTCLGSVNGIYDIPILSSWGWFPERRDRAVIQRLRFHLVFLPPNTWTVKIAHLEILILTNQFLKWKYQRIALHFEDFERWKKFRPLLYWLYWSGLVQELTPLSGNQ